MKNLEVLLRDDIDTLGKCGDVVRVRTGYARNYLFPHGKAVEATPENKRLMQRRRVRLDAEAAVKQAELDAFITALSGVTVTTSGKADEKGHLFGSVSAGTIRGLLEAKGFVVDEKSVRLEAPIKQVGEHKITIHVHGDRDAVITLVVAAEG
jgi:large subunit ribosomal protein L9